jgi:hypothetical protein
MADTLLSCVQAESKAADAAERLQQLLHKTRESWLPLWLEEHYNKVAYSLPALLVALVTQHGCL